ARARGCRPRLPGDRGSLPYLSARGQRRDPVLARSGARARSGRGWRRKCAGAVRCGHFILRGERMLKARVVGSICAVLALSLGCGDRGQPGAPPSTPTTGADAMAPEPETPAEIVHGELPKDYPTDLPLYPGATPTTSLLAGGSGLIVLSATA